MTRPFERISASRRSEISSYATSTQNRSKHSWARMRRGDKAPKTIANAFKLLNQIFVFGKRKRWCRENPCELVDPPVVKPSTDIRFLDQAELAALLRAVDLNAKPFGPIDHALFLTAAMTGLRQGELLALRWRDVDWSAGKGPSPSQLCARSLGHAQVPPRIPLGSPR
jgi:integrase